MIVIVVGMHRSGTSAMAGVLHDNGVYMGSRDVWHPPPMKENPKGFFENRLFRVVNDQLLRENGYNVKGFGLEPPIPYRMTISESVGLQMADLIHRHNDKYDNWGFKDPRTCLTLGFWLEIMDVLELKYKVILMHRNNLDIAISMKARGNEPGLGHLAKLADVYYKMVNKQYDQFVHVQYTDLMYNVDGTLHTVGEALGIKLLNGMHIDPKLADRNTAVLSDAAIRKDSHVNRC